ARAGDDGDPFGPQMLDDLIRRRVGQETQVLAAGGFVVGREPILLARRNWTEVDLLMAESHRGPRRLAGLGGSVLAGPAKHPSVSWGGGLEVRDLDDQMVQRLPRQWHTGLSLSWGQRARRRPRLR